MSENITRESSALSFGQKLYELRVQRGLQQKDVGEVFGIRASTVCNWEKGLASPDYYTLVRICRYFGVPSDYFTETGIGLTKREREHLLVYHALPAYDQDCVDQLTISLRDNVGRRLSDYCTSHFRSIPVSDLKACAGSGTYLDPSHDMKYTYLRRCRPVDEADEVVTVTGDSMEPTFFDGDKLLVKHQSTLRPGQIGIFVLNGEGLVKEYKPDGLYPHNKHYHVIRPGQEDNLRCVGLVLGCVNDGMLPTADEEEMLDKAE